ncbi:MAG: hypothetical protein ACRDUW_03480 [Pseudonocardiaceae bacterium]
MSWKSIQEAVMKKGIEDSLTLCVEAQYLFGSCMERIQQEHLPEDSPAAYCKSLVARKIGPSGPWDPSLVDRITLNSHIYLCAAEQHLRGLETLLRGNPYGLSVGPVARSVAEAAGRAAWLLDNDLHNDRIGARKRVARLLLDQEENARIYKRLSYGLNHPERAKSGDHYSNARDAICKPGMFYPSEIVAYERTGQIELAGESLPGPSGFVQAAARIFGGDANETSASYGYLSAMTHPCLFALIEMLVDAGDVDPSGGVIPLREDDRAVKTFIWNAVGDFRNGWRAWMSWVNGGTSEVQALYDAYQRLDADE